MCQRNVFASPKDLSDVPDRELNYARFDYGLARRDHRLVKERIERELASLIRVYAKKIRNYAMTTPLVFNGFHQNPWKILSQWQSLDENNVERRYLLFLFPNGDLKKVLGSPNGWCSLRSLENSIEGDFDPKEVKKYFDSFRSKPVNEVVLEELEGIYSSLPK